MSLVCAENYLLELGQCFGDYLYELGVGKDYESLCECEDWCIDTPTCSGFHYREAELKCARARQKFFVGVCYTEKNFPSDVRI